MLIHPTYFPNIAHCVPLVQQQPITFEVCDNYQKQTYRNRSEIYGANGKLVLTVPVTYTQKQRQQSKDVQIANTEQWQLQHLKSLESAYRMSPFYEFYIDELIPIFNTKYKFLLDLNLKSIDLISEVLELDFNYKLSDNYLIDAPKKEDYRFLVNSKKNNEFNFTKYTQVFTEKHGYINNLSILDLLFNEGPNTATYLQQQKLIKL